MPLIMGLALKAVGLGGSLLKMLWSGLKSLLDFALTKPFQFLVIALSLGLICAGWYGISTTRELKDTKKIVEEKILFIKGQDKVIKDHVKALDVEKKNHIRDIEKGNQATLELKKVADAAYAKAQSAARKALEDKAPYDGMAVDFGRSNPSTGKAEDRILREQKTNDAFIDAWRKAP